MGPWYYEVHFVSFKLITFKSIRPRLQSYGTARGMDFSCSARPQVVLDSVRLICMVQAVRECRTLFVTRYSPNNNSFHRILTLYCGCKVIELSDVQRMALQIRIGIQCYKNDVSIS